MSAHIISNALHKHTLIPIANLAAKRTAEVPRQSTRTSKRGKVAGKENITDLDAPQVSPVHGEGMTVASGELAHDKEASHSSKDSEEAGESSDES